MHSKIHSPSTCSVLDCFVVIIRSGMKNTSGSVIYELPSRSPIDHLKKTSIHVHTSIAVYIAQYIAVLLVYCAHPLYHILVIHTIHFVTTLACRHHLRLLNPPTFLPVTLGSSSTPSCAMEQIGVYCVWSADSAGPRLLLQSSFTTVA